MNKKIYIIDYKKENMFNSLALDEVLFNKSKIINKGFIRLSSYNKKCQSIGYFQKINNISNNILNNNITRRITGGGIVEHNNDVVLTIIFEELNKEKKRINFIYEVIHHIIYNSLFEFIPDIKLINNKLTNNLDNSHCFVSPVQFDILYKNKKMVGGALKRQLNRYLYQGSIQNHILREDEKIRNNFFIKLLDLLNESLNFNYEKYTISNDDVKMVNELSESKYNAKEWICKR